MTKRKPAKAASTVDDRTLVLKHTGDESAGRTRAKAAIGPVVRHTAVAEHFAVLVFGKDLRPPITDTAEVLADHIGKAAAGDLSLVSQILAAQAISLDGMFTDLAGRAAMNRGEYLNAAERYMRLALKAQANSRATIEALAKLHQPREQTVKHVHVNDGGQAVVADNFHQHTGGPENAKSADQSHATGTAGASGALPGPDPAGNGVPISGGERQAAMQDARRD